MSILPRTDVYLAVTAELKANGYRWREEFGGKHGKLIVDVGGHEKTVVVSLTPSDHRAVRNALGWLRRDMKNWTAELSATKDNALSTSRNEIEIHVVRDEPRVLDLDLGRRLAYGRPERIRDVIKRHEDEFLAMGGLPHTAVNPGNAGGRPSKAFYLNEEQALLAAVLSETPAASTVRATLIRSFVAWRRAKMLPTEEAERTFGIAKQVNHKITVLEKQVDEILRFITSPSGQTVPAFNLAGTVTALAIIEMAGVPQRERVRGTSSVVTRQMKDFCLKHSYGAFPTPTHIDPDGRWRFPREAAAEWLTGPSQGSEVIRSHVARHRRESAAGQIAMQLVSSRP